MIAPPRRGGWGGGRRTFQRQEAFHFCDTFFFFGSALVCLGLSPRQRREEGQRPAEEEAGVLRLHPAVLRLPQRRAPPGHLQTGNMGNKTKKNPLTFSSRPSPSVFPGIARRRVKNGCF